MRNARMDEAQAEIKVAERNTNLRYASDTTLIMAESLLMTMKEESEKTDLKLNIQKNWLKTQHSWHPVPSLHGK